MSRMVDVPAMVTGIILLGFAGIGAWLTSGHPLVGAPSMWFASVLMLAGLVGLVVSLTAPRRRIQRTHPKFQPIARTTDGNTP